MTNDEAVIKPFVGTFWSTDEWSPGNNLDNRSWYPRPGVKLVVDEVKIKNKEGQVTGAYAKVRVSESDAKAAIEQAVYRVQGDKLVAENVELNAGLLLNETLEMIYDDSHQPVGMKHHLEFSDAWQGTWICKTFPWPFPWPRPTGVGR
jgi:hypothetical protein